jgi:hypothetical protein
MKQTRQAVHAVKQSILLRCPWCVYYKFYRYYDENSVCSIGPKYVLKLLLGEKIENMPITQQPLKPEKK